MDLFKRNSFLLSACCLHAILIVLSNITYSLHVLEVRYTIKSNKQWHKHAIILKIKVKMVDGFFKMF
jgi:hypothetical protein